MHRWLCVLALTACSGSGGTGGAGGGQAGGAAGGSAGGTAGGSAGGTAGGAPLVPFDTCEAAGMPITATVAFGGQTTLGFADDYRDAGSSCGFHTMPGPDRVYEVRLPPGERL